MSADMKDKRLSLSAVFILCIGAISLLPYEAAFGLASKSKVADVATTLKPTDSEEVFTGISQILSPLLPAVTSAPKPVKQKGSGTTDIARESRTTAAVVKQINSLLADSLTGKQVGVKDGYTKVTLTVQVKAVRSGNARAGSYEVKGDYIFIDDLDREDRKTVTFYASPENSRVDVCNAIFEYMEALAWEQRDHAPGWAMQLETGLESTCPFLSKWQLRDAIDCVAELGGAESKEIRGKLLKYTKDSNLYLRLEAVRSLEKLGLEGDRASQRRLQEMANAKYSAYRKESLRKDRESLKHKDNAKDTFDVLVTYVQDVLDVLDEVKQRQMPVYQWRFRQRDFSAGLTGEILPDAAGYDLMDDHGRLIAFYGDPACYEGDIHIEIYDKDAYRKAEETRNANEPFPKNIPKRFAQLAEKLQEASHLYQQQMESNARISLGALMHRLGTEQGASSMTDEQYVELNEILERTEIGRKAVHSAIDAVVRLLGATDTRVQEKANGILVRQRQMHPQEVYFRLFSILADDSYTLEVRADVGWWLQREQLDPESIKIFLRDKGKTLNADDRGLLGFVFLCNYWLGYELTLSPRADALGYPEVFFAKSNAILELALSNIGMFMSEGEIEPLSQSSELVVTKLRHTPPRDVARYVEKMYGAVLHGFVYGDAAAFKKFLIQRLQGEGRPSLSPPHRTGSSL